MLIDGKTIADQILATLSNDVLTLKMRGITPTLAVILVGDDPASLAYIKQKQKAAAAIGVNVVFSHQSSVIRKDDLKKLFYNTITIPTFMASLSNDQSLKRLATHKT